METGSPRLNSLCLKLLDVDADGDEVREDVAGHRRGLLVSAAKTANANAVALLMLYAQRLGRSDYIYALDRQGYSAMHWAIYLGHLEVVSVMKLIDPLVALQRTANGSTAEKIVPKKSAEYMQRVLGSKHSQKQKHEGSIFRRCFMSIRSTPPAFLILLASLIVSLYLVGKLFIALGASYVAVLNVGFQVMVWYFYLNAQLTPIPTLPADSLDQYSKALSRYQYLACSKENSIQDTTEFIRIGESFCHICHIVKPPHAAHSFSQQICLIEFDHNCTFLGVPIHKGNYFYFFMFIFTMCLAMPFLVFTLKYHLWYSKVAVLFVYWTLFVWILLAPFTVVHVCLLIYGTTTYEYLNKFHSAESSGNQSLLGLCKGIMPSGAINHNFESDGAHTIRCADRLAFYQNFFACSLSPLFQHCHSCITKFLFPETSLLPRSINDAVPRKEAFYTNQPYDVCGKTNIDLLANQNEMKTS